MLLPPKHAFECASSECTGNFKNVTEYILCIVLSLLWLPNFLFHANFGIVCASDLELQYICVLFSVQYSKSLLGVP